jgi:hypothetical protein
VKIRQRRASRARTEEQANIVRACCRVPGCERAHSRNQGQQSPDAAVLSWNSRIKLILPSVKSERCLRAFLNLCGNGVLSGLAATNKLYVLHDESGTQRLVPDLPPTSGLTFCSGDLTHKLGANKRPARVCPGRSLVRPLYFAKADSRAALETWTPRSG